MPLCPRPWPWERLSQAAELAQRVRGTGGVSTPFLAPCVSLLVQQTGVDSLGGPSEHLSSGPGRPHAAFHGLLLVQAALVSTHVGSRWPLDLKTLF